MLDYAEIEFLNALLDGIAQVCDLTEPVQMVYPGVTKTVVDLTTREPHAALARLFSDNEQKIVKIITLWVKMYDFPDLDLLVRAFQGTRLGIQKDFADWRVHIFASDTVEDFEDPLTLFEE